MSLLREPERNYEFSDRQPYLSVVSLLARVRRVVDPERFRDGGHSNLRTGRYGPLRRSIMNYVEITRNARKRALYASALRYDGLTLQQIAERLGVTHRETARAAVAKGDRILQQYRDLNECAEWIAMNGKPYSAPRREGEQ